MYALVTVDWAADVGARGIVQKDVRAPPVWERTDMSAADDVEGVLVDGRRVGIAPQKLKAPLLHPMRTEPRQVHRHETAAYVAFRIDGVPWPPIPRHGRLLERLRVREPLQGQVLVVTPRQRHRVVQKKRVAIHEDAPLQLRQKARGAQARIRRHTASLPKAQRAKPRGIHTMPRQGRQRCRRQDPRLEGGPIGVGDAAIQHVDGQIPRAAGLGVSRKDGHLRDQHIALVRSVNEVEGLIFWAHNGTLPCHALVEALAKPSIKQDKGSVPKAARLAQTVA